MRLFVGVPLPEAQRQALGASLGDLRAELPRLKWVEPALYHLTLQFLGEVTAARLPAFAAALDALAGRPRFALRLGESLRLPPGRRARVFALALAEGFAPLAELAGAVTTATAALGVEPERRPFRAHLTLARAPREGTLPPELDAGRWTPPVLPAWEPDGFTLFESLLHPRGPEYRPCHRVRLNG